MQLKHIFVALTLIPAFVFGQEIWSLEKCIKYAKDNNIQIKQSELQVELAKRVALQRKATFLPSVNLQGGHQLNYGRNIDPFTNTFTESTVRSTNYGVNASMTLFNGLQNWSLAAQSHYDYMASIKDTEQRSNDVSLQIATAYLQILFGKELVKNAVNQLEISRLQKERITRLVTAGSLAESNQYDIEAQFARDELQKVNAENSLNLYYLQLYQYLQLDINTEIEVETPPGINVDGSLLSANADDVYKKAVTIMPEIQSQKLKLQSAEYALKAAYGQMSPRLMLTGSYSSFASSSNLIPVAGSARTTFVPFTTFDADGKPLGQFYTPNISYDTQRKPTNDQFKDNLNKSIGLTLTIPLFNGLSTNTNIKRARVADLTAKLQYDAVRNTLQQTVQRSYNDALSAYRQYIAADKLVVAQRESFKYADIKYQQSLINLVEFTDVKIKLSNAENDLIRAKYDYIFKTKVLDFYQGKGLSF